MTAQDQTQTRTTVIYGRPRSREHLNALLAHYGKTRVVLPEAEDWGQAELYDHSTLIFTLNAATAFSCGAIDMSEANVAAGFEYATAHTTRERDLTNALRAMLATSETAQKSGKPLDEKVISEAAKVLASN